MSTPSAVVIFMAKGMRQRREPDEDRIGRLRDVDGLRGVAVLAVVAFHIASYAPWSKMVAGSTLPMFAEVSVAPYAFLAAGVDLFFVLSGFCLAYPMLLARNRGERRPLDLAEYFARRIVRIYPAYFVALILATAAAHVARLGLHPLPRCFRGDGSLANVLQQAFFLDNGVAWVNGSFWSLAIEMRWYLVFPLALALFVRAPKLFVIVAALAEIAFAVTGLQSLDSSFIGAFLSGIVVADLRVRGVASPRTAAAFVVAGAAVGIALAPHFRQTYVQANPGWQMACVGIVLAANSSSRLRRALGWPPLVAAGVASYSIYLVHEPIVAALETLGAARIHPAALLVTCGVVSVGLGLIYWRVVERAFQGTPRSRALVAHLRDRISNYLRFVQAPERLHLEPGHHSDLEPMSARVMPFSGRSQDAIGLSS